MTKIKGLTISEYNKAYYETNKDRIKSYNKSYIKANKDKVKVWHKTYNEKHKDKIKARHKAYIEANYIYIPSFGAGAGSKHMLYTNGATEYARKEMPRIVNKVLNDCIKNPRKYLNEEETKDDK